MFLNLIFLFLYLKGIDYKGESRKIQVIKKEITASVKMQPDYLEECFH